MAVQANLLPSHSVKTLGAIKVERTVKRITFNPTEANPGNPVNPQRRSLKGLLLLFIVPYTAGTRDSEHYLNPDLAKVSVTVNGSPNRVYNEGITGIDMWREASRFFGPKSGGRPNMSLTKYLTGNKFGLFIDLRSMADTTMHGNGQRLVNTQDGIQLAIARNTKALEQ